MHEKRYLILDIETVLDRNLVGQVFSINPEAGVEVLHEQLKTRYSSGFPPPPFHIPICIALIDVEYESCKVHNATVIESDDEKTLLQHFWKIVRFRKGTTPVKTTLVHFNGRGFDLPVLFYRSLKHRIPVVFPEERSRYSFENSHDICDDLSEFGASGKPSLDVIAKMLGFAGKTDVHGSQIEELNQRGERARIKDYCMEDALYTYYIWLTTRLIRNQIDESRYREAIETAESLVNSSRCYTDPFFVLK
jgi:3'-5' exonuclease